MPKKIEPVSNWITAHDSAVLLSEKMGFPIDPKYMARLAKSKKQPVRTRSISGHQLYHKDDVLKCKVRRRIIDHDQK